MPKELFVCVGTYTQPILFASGMLLKGKGEGIYIYRMDQSSGTLGFSSKITGVVNPSFIAVSPNHRFLYAVNELMPLENKPTSTISAFSIGQENGELQFINKKLTQGDLSCHAAVDRTGRYILVANYFNGSVCVLQLQQDGSLGEPTDLIQHYGSSVNPNRQSSPHVHQTILDEANRYAFVTDLGIDKIMIYKFDLTQGKLQSNDTPWTQVRIGAGPRHFDFHPDGNYAYLINELDSTMVAFRYDKRDGTLEEIQTVSTLPKDFLGENACADLHVSPSGKFVYGSNRGHDSIVIYKIDQATGRLRYIGHESTQGKTPRNFMIDPSGRFLLVANEDSDTIMTFCIDKKTGELSSTGDATKVPTPACIKMFFLHGT